MQLRVWASCVGPVCPDARLGGRDPGNVVPSRRHAGDGLTPIYPAGTAEGEGDGQGGWDIGINFSNLHDLASQLETDQFTPGKVTRLAIHAHGLAGCVFVDGQRNEPLTADNCYFKPGRASRFARDLDTIGRATRRANPRTVILFAGCLAGQGPEGTRLLEQLSRTWPGREVVAFTTVGYALAGAMVRRGEGCVESGMRDTDVEYPRTGVSYSDPVEERLRQLWPNLRAMPWASERSPHAKMAWNGVIVRGASP